MASQRLSETFRQSKGENVSIGFSRKQSTCRKEQSRIVGSTGGVSEDLLFLRAQLRCVQSLIQRLHSRRQ